MTPHRARPPYRASTPVLVTLRSHLTTLHTPRVVRAIERAVRASAARDPKHFQVLRSAAQGEHVYLVVKASDARALSLGMRSVTIRVARTVNDLLRRSGPLWADRWRDRALATPGDVRRALDAHFR
jgi:hypothetical protein